MHTSPMISVIVPAYRCVQTLDRCIHSVLSQDFDNWELILVDDGSPDDTGILCDRWSSYDNRITSLHQCNRGVSSARNAGLSVATGTYIEFLDSDDSLIPGLFSAAVPVMETEKLDMYLFCMQRMSDGKYYSLPITGLYRDPAELCPWFEDLFSYGGHFESPCNKFFRRNTIGGICFDISLRVNEDVMFNLQYLLRCKSIYLTNKIYYLQDDRYTDSLSRSMHADFLDAEVVTRPLLKKFLEQCGVPRDKAMDVINKRQAAVYRNQFGILIGRGGSLPLYVQKKTFSRIFSFEPARMMLLEQLASDPNQLQATVISFCVKHRLSILLSVLCRIKNLLLKY